MAEKTIQDLLSVDVDSLETKTLNATAVFSLKSAGPDGEIVFDSTEILIPGYIAETSSLAYTASYAVLASSSISSSYALTASYALNSGVSQLIAGTNIVLSPSNGLGIVTISSTGGGGGSGAGANVTSSFTNQSTWTFVHALGNRGVIVQTFDTSWNQIIPQNIALTDDNTATITFPTNQSGYAIASLGGVTDLAATASYAVEAGNTSTIDINVFSAPVDSYLLMSNVAGTTGVAIGGDADLRYNSSINVLTVPNISATTLTGSLLGTASNATLASTSSLALGISASSINSNTKTTYDASNVKSIGWDDRTLFDTSGNAVINWAAGSLTGSLQGTASWATNALTSSRVNTLNQNVIITGSVAIGTGSVGSGENSLLLGPAPSGGTGEGGQIALLAAGGSYTSSSFLDNWQNQFRILRGPGATSNAGLMYMDLQSGNTQFIGAVTASAYSNLPNSWMHALRTSNQTIGSGTWANRDIIFDQLASNNFTYNSSTGIATLKAGKTYRITARLAWAAAGLYTLKFRVYNQTTSAFTGPTVELIQSPNGTYNVSDGTLESIFAVGASDVDISIRTTSDTNALTGEYIRGDLNTQLIIQQIA